MNNFSNNGFEKSNGNFSIDGFENSNINYSNSGFEKSNVDSIWNDLISNYSEEVSNKQRNGIDNNTPLKKLLQSYNYTPNSINSPLSAPLSTTPQNGHMGGVFRFPSDDSTPESGSSSCARNSYIYSTSSGGSYLSRSVPPMSSLSEAGSPSLDEALMLGALPNSPFGQDQSALPSPSTKVKDLILSDLMTSLSLNGNATMPTGSLGASNNLNGQYLPATNGNAVTTTTLCNNGLNSAIQTMPGGLNRSMTGFGMTQNNLGLNNTPHNNLPMSCLNQNSMTQNSDAANNLARLQRLYYSSQMTPSASRPIPPSHMCGGGMGGCGGGVGSSPFLASSFSSIFPGTLDPYAIEKAAKVHRNSAAVCDASCTWSGPLPARLAKNPVYSCKVFLGGVPWDVTELDLREAFVAFGCIQVQWPGKDNCDNPPKGYVYVLFDEEPQVKAMLASCIREFAHDNFYFKISSRRMRQKEVQVIPWVISDSNYVRCPSYQLDPAKTVFVGALHGMLSAQGLAKIMDDLFGGVVYSGIDTDKHKYPIGSGRVTFNNVISYRKAVRAAFIEIKTPKFTKNVQVDPYLADSQCQSCCVLHGPYFCRDEACFKYYCRNCWQIAHTALGDTHKPLMRDPKLRQPTTVNRLI